MRLLSLFGLALLCSACNVVVPNVRICHVAGVLDAGSNCAETNTGTTSEMNFDETLDFLEAQPERPDPATPGQMLPARGAAACMSADDFGRLKTSIELACRMLGKRCTYEMRQAIAGISRL